MGKNLFHASGPSSTSRPQKSKLVLCLFDPVIVCCIVGKNSQSRLIHGLKSVGIVEWYIALVSFSHIQTLSLHSEILVTIISTCMCVYTYIYLYIYMLITVYRKKVLKNQKFKDDSSKTLDISNSNKISQTNN